MDNIEANKTEGDDLRANQIFSMMAEYLAQGHGKEVIPKVGATFQFDIIRKKGGKVEGSWEINLKDGKGHCKKGKAEGPDATFTMTDDDFHKVCMRTLNPQMAFMQGKMKIKGNMGKASKFTPDLFPPPTEENIKKFSGAKA